MTETNRGPGRLAPPAPIVADTASPPARTIWRWSLVLLAFLVGFGVGVTLTLVGVNKVHRAAQAKIAGAESQRPQGLQPPPLPSAAILSTADDMRLRPLQGNSAPVTLTGLRGKTVFLHLWATWCAPCLAEMPTVQALYHDLPADRFSFLLVSTEPEAVVRTFLQRRGLPLPFYLGSEPLPTVFSSPELPMTYVISPAGRIVVRHFGAADWHDPSVVRFMYDLEGGRG